MTRRSGLKIERHRRRSVWHHETKNFSYAKIKFGLFLVGTIIQVVSDGKKCFYLYSGELFMFNGEDHEFESFKEAFLTLEDHFKIFLYQNREKIMKKLQRRENDCFKELNLANSKNWNTKIHLGLRDVSTTKRLLMRL